ncbi:hypothetical protein HZS61_003186 [Fusarium oxysporum f. sp. conglutinans]|uniref:HTH CENPB-type domain-containing protein n=3 Tax=Fusarium oxysporum TaxID=5507 RepID=A0A8H6LG36_FUSOX|nr:hypothetical protein HZS61_003186 [Fusarium oxysporum f. sp. conglutinans]
MVRRNYTEDDVAEAILDTTGRGLSQNEAAQKRGVPQSTLSGRLSGQASRNERIQAHQRIPKSQGEMLIRWVLRQESLGYALSHSQVRACVEAILQQQGDNKPLGKYWTTRFVKRHLELSTKLGKRQEAARFDGFTPKAVNWYFDIRENEYGWIKPENTVNVDEGGIMVGFGLDSLVIGSSDPKKKAMLKGVQSRTWTSFIEAVTATGRALKPGIIFKGKELQKQWFLNEFELIADWHYITSPNGWTDNHIALEWLKDVYLPQTEPRDASDARLIILDGHGSHAQDEWMATCFLNNVYCCYLPAHCSHGLQPLDNGIFNVIKGAYRKELQKLASLTDSAPDDKVHFIRAYAKAREAGMRKDIILSGWRFTGNWPINRYKALAHPEIQPDKEKLLEEFKTPSPPQLHSDDTPKTSRQVRDLAKHRSRPTRRKYSKMAKGLEALEMKVAVQNARITGLEEQMAQVQRGKKTKAVPNPNRRFMALAETLTAGEALPDSKKAEIEVDVDEKVESVIEVGVRKALIDRDGRRRLVHGRRRACPCRPEGGPSGEEGRTAGEHGTELCCEAAGVEGAFPRPPPSLFPFALAWCRTPRAAADGSLYSWPDGELVTPDKLAAWLKEDILLRRVAPPQKKPRARGKGKGKGKAVQLRRQLEQEQLEAAALAEAESLAEALEVPLAEAAELLADDREGYVPPTALAPAAADLAEGSLLTRGTIDAYIAAVIELWRLQVAHGNANTENPRGAAVRGFLEQRGRQRGKHDRASFKDRGTDGIQAGYSPDEWLRVQDLLLSGAAYMPQNLRTRVDLLFGHYYLLRGENRRKMELADLSLLDYPSSEGPTPCGCLVTLLRDGKLNKTAKKEFMGALRHKDPLFCTQGALAQLFFWRWHVAGEPSPSFRRRQDWYRIKVLVGRDREQELSYPTQLQETWRIFGAAGLMASKKTHLPRRVGAQDAETHGTSLAQISQAGRWNQSVLCQAYLTHLPRQFMRIVAGFSASPGDYFLARAAHEPPYVLEKQLWPWIEEWEPRFEARARRQCWAEGGLDDDDLAADGFLKLMRRLRIVLLQDLAVLQPRYPSLPFFAYAPFNGPEWDEFAVAVRSDAVGATEPLSLLVQRALPELSGVLPSRTT